MKKPILALVSALLLVCWPAQLLAQTVTWGSVSASPSFVSTQGSILTHWGLGAPNFTPSQGTTSATWQFSAPNGPQWSNNAGAIEARNAALNAYAIVRGATPVASNDLVTLGYLTPALAAITIPSLTGVATSTGCLSFGGGVYAWASCGGGGTSVTGTGFWYNATGTLNGAAVGLSGDGTLGALSGGNVPLTLATVNGNVGTFGNTTTIPVVTVNAKGLITGVTTAAVSGTSVTGTGLWYSATGSLNAAAVGLSGDATIGALSGSNLPLTLATVNGNVGTFGTASTIPIVTVNAKGLVTAVTTSTVAAALGSATGTLTPAHGGTGLTTLTANGVVIGEGTANVNGVVLGNTQILVGQTAADPQAKTLSGDATLSNAGALTLATVNGSTGSFGSASAVPIFSVNGKGLITAASTATVAAPLGSATGTLASTQITPGSAGQVLMTNLGASSSVWNSFTGDVGITGTGSTTVNSISGGSPMMINNANLVAWAAGVSTPELRQLQQTSNIANNDLRITPQKPFASASGTTNGTPGSLIAALGIPVSTGAEPQFRVTRNGVFQGAIGNYNSSSFVGLWLGTSTEPTILSDGVTQFLGRGNTQIIFDTGNNFGTQYGGTGASRGWQFGYPGVADFGGGDNVIGLSPALVNPTSLTTSGVALSVPSHNVLELEATTLQFPKFAGAISIVQATASASTNGSNLTLQAQNGGTGTSNGGNIFVQAGTASGGTTGLVALNNGDGSYGISVAPTGNFLQGNNLEWLSTVAAPSLFQQRQPSDLPTASLVIQGQQAASGAVTNPNGGNVFLFGGQGTTGAHGGDAFVVAGDGSTGLTLIPGAIGTSGGVFGNSYSGTILTTNRLIPFGSGTVNSQQTLKESFRLFCRTTSATPINCGDPVTIGSGVSYTFRVLFSGRDVTTTNGTLDFAGEKVAMVRNVGGTATQIGASSFATPAAIVGTGAPNPTLSYTLSSANVQFKAGFASGGTDTYDWEIEVEALEN